MKIEELFKQCEEFAWKRDLIFVGKPAIVNEGGFQDPMSTYCTIGFKTNHKDNKKRKKIHKVSKKGRKFWYWYPKFPAQYGDWEGLSDVDIRNLNPEILNWLLHHRFEKLPFIGQY